MDCRISTLEFAVVNETARDEKATLESRKTELQELVSKERGGYL